MDNIAPILSDIQNSSNGAWAKSITLSWEITEEESGIAKVEYSTDNLKWIELSKEEWNGFTRNNERNDMLYIRVTDKVGNVSEIKSTTMKIDNTIPSATWNIGNNVYGNNGWYQSLSLQSTIKDSYGEIAAVRYCTTTGSTCTPNVNASISNNTFTVTLESNASPQKVCTEVIDKAGNTSGVICSSSYSVDTTNPTATISASVSGNAITVQATGSDAHSGIASYQYSRDNSAWYTGSSTYTFTGLADGNYTLYVKVTNWSGRVSNTVSTTATVAYTNVYVSSSGNDSTGNGSSSRPYATIQTAYNKVANGGNIILLSNISVANCIYFQNSAKSVTVKSNGSSIFSMIKAIPTSVSENFIYVSGTTVTFTNIKLDGASTPYSSSIMYINAGTVNLNSGTTITNHVSNNATTINNLNGTININGATITNNKLNGNAFGTAIHCNGGKVTLNSGTISNNSGTQVGGTIRIISNGTFTMNGGTISNNSANTAAGISVDGGTINLNGGTITGNVASSQGGGVGVWSGNNPSSLVVAGTSITNNTGYGIYLVGSNTNYTYKSGNISGNSPSNIFDGR